MRRDDATERTRHPAHSEPSPPAATPAALGLASAVGNVRMGLILGARRAVLARVDTQSVASAGNQAVTRMLSVPAPPQAEKRYDAEFNLGQFSFKFHQLTPAEMISKLRQVWHFAHGQLDDGREENEQLVKLRAEHRTAGYWSEGFGLTDVPDPGMWNEIGTGTLMEVRKILDAADAALKEHPDPAQAFDTTQQRITQVVALLERSARQLAACYRKLDEYVGDTNRGAKHAITGIKVTIVLFEIVEAGRAGQAASAAGHGATAVAGAVASTAGGLGAVEEGFNQVGEMRIGEREHFDLAKIAKRGVTDTATTFVGMVIGGKFAEALGARLGRWIGTLSDEFLASHRLTRAVLRSSAPAWFSAFVAGAASSPFMTATAALMHRALDGKWQAHTWAEFLDEIVDDLERNALMSTFLLFASRVEGHGTPAEGEQPHDDKISRAEQQAIDAAERAKTKVIAKPAEPEPTTPVRETRVKGNRKLTGNRQFLQSQEAVRKAVHDRLEQVRRHGEATLKRTGRPPKIDSLITDLAKTDPAFAKQVRQYYDSISDMPFVENAMLKLWNQARLNKRTVAAELEATLGGKVNEFRNDTNLSPLERYEEFRRAILDPRALVDMSNAADTHSAHIHAFQQYLGDQLWGPGKGLEFRQRLARVQGPSETVAVGQPHEHDKPFWSQLWDELFDASGNLHSPEEIGPILLDLLDFPVGEF